MQSADAKIDNQVANRVLCNSLREMGVKQSDALYAWIHVKNKQDVKWVDHSMIDNHPEYFVSANVKEWSWADWDCAAFTSAELGEMLPERSRTVRLDGYWMVFMDEYQTNPFTNTEAEIEADARAKTLIYLISHRLLKTPKAIQPNQLGI